MKNVIVEDGLLLNAYVQVGSEEQNLVNNSANNDEVVSSANFSVVFCTFVISCGAFAYGCGFGYSSPAESGIMKDMGLSTAEYSVFGSILTFGGMLGAIVSGTIADLIGRRRTLWLFQFFCIMGWIAIIFAEDALWLDLGRLSMGIGFGLYIFLVTIFTAEIAPKEIRGTCAAVTEVVGIFFMQESPRWLAMVGREEECESSLRCLRGKHVDISEEAYQIKEHTKQDLLIHSESRFMELFNQKNAKSLTGTAAGACLGSFLMGLAFLLKDLHLLKDVTPLLVLIGLLVYSASYSMGLLIAAFVIMSEIFPMNIKGKAGSLVILANWISSWIVSYSFNFLYQWSAPGVFFLFATICCSLYLFTSKLVPETKGRTLEEIQASMTSNLY